MLPAPIIDELGPPATDRAQLHPVLAVEGEIPVGLFLDRMGERAEPHDDGACRSEVR